MAEKLIYDLEELKKPSEPVRLHIGLMVAEELKEAFEPIKNRGVGLAAPQIGRRLKVMYVNCMGAELIMMNPEVIQEKGESYFEECCFSLPHTLESGGAISIKRAKRIKVKFMDEAGETKILKFDGLIARAILHEIDHLAGVLIIDRRKT